MERLARLGGTISNRFPVFFLAIESGCWERTVHRGQHSTNWQRVTSHVGERSGRWTVTLAAGCAPVDAALKLYLY